MARAAAARKRNAPRRISLALQGGGSHGAFTWGVLDRLLEQDDLEICQISGASAGAMNAAALLEGHMRGGREGARACLEHFWKRVSELAMFSPVRRTLWDTLMGNWAVDSAPGYQWMTRMVQQMSPYQFNPLGVNPLRDLIAETIDFSQVRSCTRPRLHVTATNVWTGKVRVFSGADVTPDALAASACLPRFFQAVMIDGEPYWDGGYMGNPSLFPLFYDDAPEDILLVQINPIERRETPDTVEEIANRIDEITFNAGLLHELRAIEFVERLIDRGVLQGGQGYRKLRLHKIQASEDLVHYKAASKLDAEWPFLQHLRDLGRAAADAWLNENLEHIGKRATLDLRATFN